jgi:hypothetical protein
VEMKSSRTVTAAWAGAVLTSCATIIPWRELSGGEPSWWPYVTLAGLLALLEATYMRADIRPLKMYVLYLLFVYVLGYGGGLRWGLVTWVKENAVWIDLMNELPPFLSEIALHLLRLVPMFIVLGTLLVEGRKLGNLYLKKGNLNAVAAPSRLIGTIKPEPWTKVGTIFTAVFCAGTLSFLILTTKLTWDSLPEAIGTLPTVVVIAALNAFNEEFTLRAAPLSMLESAVGREQALRVTTFFFGVGHYYGVPHGVVGVLLAGFLGWFLGKSMQETGGFMWAWLIHFLQDVKIFTFSLM